MRLPLALLLVVAVPALSQPAPLPEGGSVEGELTATGPAFGTGQRIVEHALTVTAEGPFEVALTSSDFDTFLILRPPSGEQIYNDDWGGSASESRVVVGSAEPGLWRIGVVASKPEEWGAYRLSHRGLDSGVVEQADAASRSAALSQRVAGLYNEGRYGEAMGLAREALALREGALGPDHPDVAESLNDLGVLLEAQGDYAAARPLLERALAVREAALGPDDLGVAKSLNNLAALLEAQGDYGPARPLYGRALAIREAALGASHPDVARSLNNLAALLEAQGDYAAARPLLERALAIWEAALGPGHPDVARSLNNLAALLEAQGDYAAARPLYERALAIQEAALGPSHPDVARSLSNLAALLGSQGDIDAARPLYEQALATREAALGPKHPDVATSLNNLAALLEAQGDDTAARSLYERALAIREAALGPGHPEVALSLNSLAALLDERGDDTAARPLYERALAIQEAALGPGHPEVALTLNNLAVLLVSQGDYAAARPLLERALGIHESALGPDHPDLARLLNNLAALLGSQGDTDEARPLVERAARIYDGHVEGVLPTLSAAEQRAFVDLDLGAQTSVLLSTHRDGEAPATAYASYGGWKGLLLRELRRQTAVAALGADPKHAEAVAELRALRGRVAAAYRTGAPELGALTAEKEAIERRLALALPPEAATDPWRDGGRGGLGADLPEGAAFADVYRYVPRGGNRAGAASYAAVVTRQGAGPIVVDLGPAEALDAALDAWRAAVTSGRAAQTDALADALWGPIAEALPAGTDRVWVAPDAALARAPWAALAGEHGPMAGRLVAQVPSGRALLGLLARGAVAPDGPGGSALVVGGVDFGVGGAFAPLPGTAAEALAVTALAEAEGLSVEPMAGDEPTASAVAQALPGVTYAHLATHGFFYAEPEATRRARQAAATRGGRPLRTDEEEGAGPAAPSGPGDWGRSPLALSGLALAGANAPTSAPGGGTLTAEEIVGLDLSAVRLIALSACDTGRGAEVTGQGVLGLQASLAAAGAQTLLMSLWPVDDAATAALMEAFYRGLWQEDLPPAVALRRAQAEVRSAERWAPPVFWAGWTLSGAAF